MIWVGPLLEGLLLGDLDVLVLLDDFDNSIHVENGLGLAQDFLLPREGLEYRSTDVGTSLLQSHCLKVVYLLVLG